MSKEKYNEMRNQAWREELRKAVPMKDRTAGERVKMNEVPPVERIKSQLVEVNLGLTPEQAQKEAKRCMDCANHPCINGCPVGIDIPTFVKQIEKGEFGKAANTLREYSSLPAVCGRVCPQEKQCEAECTYHKMKKEPVAIGYLERFAADYAIKNPSECPKPEKKPANGIKIAAIGAGPTSLAFAGDMAKLGYDVTVFEALHEIGGVLKYGIPEFRLPNSIVDSELKAMEELGVKFVTNFLVGRTATLEQLSEEHGFKAFYVGSGAGLPRFMNIPGENLNGVMSSNEYLTRVNLMGAGSEDSETPVLRGNTVMVVGGGNTAMDSVRTAKRLGAERAIIVYRRSREEMPARLEEVYHAEQEGIEFMTLHNPIEYIGTEKGRVRAVRLQKMELGEPDASGRRKPVPIKDAIVELPIDLAVVAVGVSPNPLLLRTLKGVELSKWGTIVVNEETNQSSDPDIFAGGDIVRGGATVILAMGDGRKAAASMDEYLRKKYNLD